MNVFTIFSLATSPYEMTTRYKYIVCVCVYPVWKINLIHHSAVSFDNIVGRHPNLSALSSALELFWMTRTSRTFCVFKFSFF